MTKQQLIDQLAQNKGLSRQTAKRLVNIFFKSISDTLAEGGRIEIRDFGIFSVRTYNGRTGKNPKTGEIVEVPSKRLPFFKVGKNLMERLNGV
ncbi:MAG TPA: HU family DNA-binding protein [Thermodesulfobacteriota bacterium]|nr:integration host factor subunit beta [Deltaproteobacteria bacterium]HNR12336.1 HU family DNA-binding protein [Thermodesulfobacteriota bacterium]HNU71279.1 HU family DNA-binding protein [Thermodesulfobacteriota bacterium]HQO78559.1 HU family DNA-binding protein [Thermodesulfobacteriota bacterium]